MYDRDLLVWNVYSGTSDKGQPLYKGHLFQPHANSVLIDLRDKDNLSTRDKTAPIVSLVRRFHCSKRDSLCVCFQCLVIGEITCSHLMVVLNKTDLTEESKRDAHISKVYIHH